MKKTTEYYSVIRKLLFRLDSLIVNVKAIATDRDQVGHVRYKPLFTTYNSIVEEFKSTFPEEHKHLSLEELPIFDEKGNELFTQKKLSTLLHQSTDIDATLRGLLPPEDTALGNVSEVTLHWLRKYVPMKFWVWLVGILFAIICSVFLAGVRIGQTSWFQELMGKTGQDAHYETEKGTSVKGMKEGSKEPKSNMTKKDIEFRAPTWLAKGIPAIIWDGQVKIILIDSNGILRMATLKIVLGRQEQEIGISGSERKTFSFQARNYYIDIIEYKVDSVKLKITSEEIVN